jgi:hypothetical protein
MRQEVVNRCREPAFTGSLTLSGLTAPQMLKNVLDASVTDVETLLDVSVSTMFV